MDFSRLGFFHTTRPPVCISEIQQVFGNKTNRPLSSTGGTALIPAFAALPWHISSFFSRKKGKDAVSKPLQIFDHIGLRSCPVIRTICGSSCFAEIGGAPNSTV